MTYLPPSLRFLFLYPHDVASAKLLLIKSDCFCGVSRSNQINIICPWPAVGFAGRKQINKTIKKAWRKTYEQIEQSMECSEVAINRRIK